MARRWHEWCGTGSGPSARRRPDTATIDLLGWQATDGRVSPHTKRAETTVLARSQETARSLLDHSAVPVPHRAGERPDQHPQQGRHERQRDKDRQNHPAPPLRWFRLRPLTLDPRRPIAAPLQRCAQLLGVDLVTICAAAANVEPYVCANGTRIWSLMQLERQLRPEVYGRQQAG